MAASVDLICIRCHKRPDQIEEYVEIAAHEEMTPDQFVREQEGTYNFENGHFLCTECYVAVGCPSRPFPGRWVAP